MCNKSSLRWFYVNSRMHILDRHSGVALVVSSASRTPCSFCSLSSLCSSVSKDTGSGRDAEPERGLTITFWNEIILDESEVRRNPHIGGPPPNNYFSESARNPCQNFGAEPFWHHRFCVSSAHAFSPQQYRVMVVKGMNTKLYSISMLYCFQYSTMLAFRCSLPRQWTEYI